MRCLKAILIGLAVLIVAIVSFVYAGTYNVAADEPHWEFTHRLIDTVLNRSIGARASSLLVPTLNDASMARRGAGNYDAMCVGCHLAPAMVETELSRGLYPAPPKLAEHGRDRSPEQTFWIIKHGIKASGMPAWGKSMEDHYIWDMVAFLHKLPGMTAEQYRAEVAASGGHAHGGGETLDMHVGNAARTESDAVTEESRPHVHTPADDQPDGRQ